MRLTLESLEASMRIISSTGGCSDGTCPAIHETDDPELVAVQGATLTDGQALADLGPIPGHEGVVLVPRSLFDTYAKGRP
jgi:hypothetical protein